MRLNRRSFLKNTGLALVAGAAMPLVFQRGVAAASQEESNGPHPRRILIVVQLRGGNDALNSVVPFTNQTYYDLRGELAIPDDEILPLDNEMGFHPNLLELLPMWQSGDLAIVEGVGYPSPSYSHFVSMGYWETAMVTPSDNSGWLGQYLENLDSAIVGAVPAMNVGRELAPELANRMVPVSTVENLNNYRFKEDRGLARFNEVRMDTLHGLYASSASGEINRVLSGAFQAAVDGSIAVQEAHARYVPSVVYPDSELATNLMLLAEAIHFNEDLRVGHVVLNGFDTHANQSVEHADLLKEFSQSLSAFWTDISHHGHGNEVVVMTWSEFGRRPDANASGGTDHGSAGSMFLLGTAVNGGFHGGRVSLTDLDRRNLKFTTDFRSVYSSVLEDWLGSPSIPILGGTFENLKLIRG